MGGRRQINYQDMSAAQRIGLIGGIALVLLLAIVPGVTGKSADLKPEPKATVSAGRLNVRSGPDVDYSVVDTVDRNETLPAVGRNPDGSWVQVRLPGDYAGWVDAKYIATNQNFTKLPVTFDPAARPVQPHMTLSDGVVSPGKAITVLAEGFQANERVDAFLYSSDAGVRQKLGSGVTDNRGTVQLDLVMPSTWGNGETISQSNVLLSIGAPDSAVSETAELNYIFGREAAQVPPLVDGLFTALRGGDLEGARVHLTGSALQRLDMAGSNGLYNLTGVDRNPAEITGLGTRVVQVREDRVKAESVLIFGDTFVRLTSDLVRVQDGFQIENIYVTGIYEVEDTAVAG